jgi:hypothetical protein
LAQRGHSTCARCASAMACGSGAVVVASCPRTIYLPANACAPLQGKLQPALALYLPPPRPPRLRPAGSPRRASPAAAVRVSGCCAAQPAAAAGPRTPLPARCMPRCPRCSSAMLPPNRPPAAPHCPDPWPQLQGGRRVAPPPVPPGRRRAVRCCCCPTPGGSRARRLRSRRPGWLASRGEGPRAPESAGPRPRRCH